MIFGAQPDSCPTMIESLYTDSLVHKKVDDNFVDGASVGKVGTVPFEICKEYVDRIYTASNGRICEEILNLYNNDGIVAEPAGALSLSVLEKIDKTLIRGKNVVCILSGGNNDISEI